MTVNTDKVIAALASSTDTQWIENCKRLHVKLGNDNVVKAADQRLRDLALSEALRIRPRAQSLEERVDEMVRVRRALLKHEHGHNQAAGYTERDIKKYGARETLIKTIMRGKETDGFKLFAKHGRLDCAYEQIAIDFVNELPEHVVEQARKNLARFS